MFSGYGGCDDIVEADCPCVRLLRPLVVVGVLLQVCVRVCSPDVVPRR